MNASTNGYIKIADELWVLVDKNYITLREDPFSQGDENKIRIDTPEIETLIAHLKILIK